MQDISIHELVSANLREQLFDQISQVTPDLHDLASVSFSERIGFHALSAPDAPKLGFNALGELATVWSFVRA